MNEHVIALLRSYSAEGCGEASLADGVAVPLMQCTLLVRAGIGNLLTIARLLSTKDAVGSFAMTVYRWDGIQTQAGQLRG